MKITSEPLPRRPAPAMTSGTAIFFRLLLVLLLLGGTGCQSVMSWRWQRMVQAKLTGMLEAKLTGLVVTEHFDVRYEPGSRSEAHARRIAAVVEIELAEICRRLAVKNDERYTLFLFDRPDDVGKLIETPGVGGFSMGRFFCVGVGDDAARFHELIHTVATAKVGNPKKAFLLEGLAGALFDPRQGMDPHAGAKDYRQRGKLPSLTESFDHIEAKGWIDWLGQLREVNGYTIAGSWMQFLLETHGPEKTKHYYLGRDPSAVFGRSVAELEKDWLRALDAYEVPPAIKARLEFSEGSDPHRYTAVVGEALEVAQPVLSLPPELTSAVVKYAWRKNGADLPGSSSGAIAIKPLVLADAGIYTLTITLELPDGQKSVAAKSSVALTVLPRPADFGEVPRP
jgi:hypothetical protein